MKRFHHEETVMSVPYCRILYKLAEDYSSALFSTSDFHIYSLNDRSPTRRSIQEVIPMKRLLLIGCVLLMSHNAGGQDMKISFFTISKPDSHTTEPSVLVEADTSYLGDPVFSMQTIIRTTAILAIPDSAAMRFVIKESYSDSVIADEIIGFDERSAGSFVYTLSIIMDFPVNFEVTAQAYVFTVNRWTYWSNPISVRYDSRHSQGGMGQTQPPSDFALAPIYPNPLSIGNGLQVVHIPFHLPEKVRVRIAVYNLLGQEIIRLLEDNAIMPAGRHTITWDGRNALGQLQPSGIYFIRLTTIEGFEAIRKMALQK